MATNKPPTKPTRVKIITQVIRGEPKKGRQTTAGVHAPDMPKLPSRGKDGGGKDK